MQDDRLSRKTQSSDDESGVRSFEKMPRYSVFSEFAYSFILLAGMLAELTVSGVEIERHIRLLQKP